MVYIASPFFSEEELNNVKLVEKILSDRKIDFLCGFLNKKGGCADWYIHLFKCI